TLVQESATVVEARGGAARILIEHKIHILVGLGGRAVGKQAESRDQSARILQGIGASRKQPRLELRINRRALGAAVRRNRIRDTDLDLPDTVVSQCRLHDECRYSCSRQDWRQSHDAFSSSLLGDCRANPARRTTLSSARDKSTTPR